MQLVLPEVPLSIIVLASLAGLATCLGSLAGWLFMRNNRVLDFSLSFAGAIMTLIALFDLFPVIRRDTSLIAAVLSIFGGAVLIYLSGKFIPHVLPVKRASGRNNRFVPALSLMLAAGMLIHDLPEGFAIANAYSASAPLGTLVAFALFAHNLPEGYILSLAARNNGALSAYVILPFLSTASTLLGALLGSRFSSVCPSAFPLLAGIAAGSMLYISVNELLPAVARRKRWLELLAGLVAASAVHIILEALV